MFIKNIFRTLWIWGKTHIFDFIITMVTIMATVSILFVMFTQHTINHSLQAQIDSIPNTIKISEYNLKSWVDDTNILIIGKIDSTNARIDVINSTIKPDKKRRILITNIRNAITENTNRTIGVRDLNRIASAVIDYSYEFNFSIPQILAQIKTESDFNVYAQSGAKAQGLMQIIPPTLKYIQHEMPNPPSKLTPWNIHHNIRSGCFYMSQQIETFGTYEEALRAYNWGPSRLAKFNAGEIQFEPQETLDYVPRIKKYIEVFNKYGLE